MECWLLDIEGIIRLDQSVFGNLKIDAGYIHSVLINILENAKR